MGKQKAITIGVLFLLVFFSAIGFFYYQEKVSEKLRFFALKRLESALGADLQVGSIEIHILTATLTLENVTFPKHKEQKDWPALFVRKMKIVLSPWSLLTEVLVIKKIVVKGPEIRVSRDRDGRWTWTAPPLKLGGTGLRPTLIRRIVIEEGQITFRDDQNDLTLVFPLLEASITPDLAMKTYEADFLAERGVIRHPSLEEKNLKAFGQMRFRPNRLELANLELSLEDINLTLRGDISRLETSHPQVNLLGDINLSSAPFHRARLIHKNLTGTAHIQTEISGDYPDLKMKGKVFVKNLHLKDADLFEGNLNFSFFDKTLTVDQLKGKGLEGTLSGKLELAFQQRTTQYRVEARVEDLSLEKIQLPLPSEFTLSGRRLTGEIKASGKGFSLNSLKAQGWFRSTGRPAPVSTEFQKGERARGRFVLHKALNRFGPIKASFEIDGGKLHLQDALLKSDQTSIQMDGTLPLEAEGKLDLDLHLTTADAEEVMALIGLGKRPSKPRFLTLAGPLEFTGRLEGDLLSPILEGTMHAQQLVLRRHPIGPVLTDLRFEGKNLSFQNAILSTPPSSYTFRGEIQLSDRALPEFDIEATVQQGSIEQILEVFYKRLPINASFGGDFSVRGKPKQFLVTADLEMGQGSVYGQSFQKGTVRVQVTSSRVSFPKISLQRDRSHLEGSGWISFDGKFSAELDSQELHLEDLDLFKPVLPYIGAVLSLKLNGSGRLREPQFQGRAELKNLVISNQELGAADLRGTLRGKDLTFEADLEQGKAKMEGTLKLQEDLPLTASLAFSKFPAGSFLRQLSPSLFEEIELTTTGQVSLSGSAADPSSLKAEGTLTDLLASIGEYKVTNEGDASLEYDRGRFQIHSFRLKGEGTALSISGKGELKKRLDIFINGEADLNVFRLISKEFSYGKGKVYLVLKITDQWDNPNIQGGMTVQGGSLRSETLAQVVTITSMELFFNQRQIVLENLEGETSGGRLQASGKMEIKNLRPERFGLTVELSDVRITPAEELTATLSGTFFLQGDTRSRRIGGEFQIQRARYTNRIDLKSWMVEFRERRQRPITLKSTPFLGEASLDLHFFGKSNIWIENNLAQVPLELDLFVKGTFDRPLLLGHIEAREGEIYFRRNVFEVQSALLDLIGTDRIKPVIDLKAETDVRDYRVQLSLTGRLDKELSLNLTSDPPLSQTDILGLLTVGKTTEELAELSAAEGTGEATAFTTSILFDEFVEERVKELTGIDRFQVDPYSTSSKAASGPRLTVQKRLLEDRLSVTYISAVDPAEEEVIKLEYQIDRGISLIGERDESGRMGGDIKFRLEFR